MARPTTVPPLYNHNKPWRYFEAIISSRPRTTRGAKNFREHLALNTTPTPINYTAMESEMEIPKIETAPIPLCKETPDTLYGIFYCLLAFLFYLITIIVALLYICRTFGCVKWRFSYGPPPSKEEEMVEHLNFFYPKLFPKGITLEEAGQILTTVPDGHSPANKNSPDQPTHSSRV